MTGMIVFGGLLLAMFTFFAMVFTFVALAFKFVIWMVLLPLRLIGWALGAVFMLIGTVIAIALGLAMLLAPLIPLAIFVGIIYGLYRLVRRPATT